MLGVVINRSGQIADSVRILSLLAIFTYVCMYACMYVCMYVRVNAVGHVPVCSSSQVQSFRILWFMLHRFQEVEEK